MGQIIPIRDAAASLELDRKVFRLRLAGASVRKIADELGCTLDEVEGAVARMCGAVTPQMRTRAIQLDLDRLDAFQQAHYEKALAGDVDATVVSLKIIE